MTGPVTQEEINKYLSDTIYPKCDELINHMASLKYDRATAVLICFTIASTMSKECSAKGECLPIQPLINGVVDSLVEALLTDDEPQKAE